MHQVNDAYLNTELFMQPISESQPIVPFIQGDGIGVDIMPVTIKVIDAAVDKAFNGEKQIQWQQVLAGESALSQGLDALPIETLETLKKASVVLKGPLATMMGDTSVNAAIRQALNLDLCRRNIHDFSGRASLLGRSSFPLRVVMRHNEEAMDLSFADQLGLGLQHEQAINDGLWVSHHYWSKIHTENLMKSALEYALLSDMPCLTLVHRAHLLPHTEGLFLQWAQDWLANNCDCRIDNQAWWLSKDQGSELKIQFLSVEAFLQQCLNQPNLSQLVVTYCRYGDAVSDVLAAQVGGIGVVPTAHLSASQAVFEPSHGTAPKHAGQDKANPTSLILAGEMLLRHLGWNQAADLVHLGVANAIEQRMLTMDLAKQVEGINPISCSEFGNAVIEFIRNH